MITPMWTGECDLRPLRDDRGRQRFRRWGWLWKVPLFEFRNGRPPLTFHDSDDIAYQPDNHFHSDGGSVPPLLWGVPLIRLDPFAFPRSYAMHDCAFRYGGLYVRHRGERLFHFERLARPFCDALLWRMVRAEGARVVNAAMIRAGVFMGSRFAWDPVAQMRARAEDRLCE